jgi:hypothetical protein
VLVHLLPLGHDRFDVYAEPPDVEEEPLPHDAGRVRRWIRTAGDQWRRLVDTARTGSAAGRLARYRDTVVCKLAESIEEQRTLWSLRGATSATALFPAGLTPSAARATLDRLLAASRRHHGWWFAIDLTLFIASGILFFVPGPNIVAYYLGFRSFGHLQSWRGARQAASVVQWTLQPSDELAELAILAGQPHDQRRTRVEAIARKLDLQHLPAFFERAAA